MTTLEKEFVSIDDYFLQEIQSEFKHEWVHGDVLAMAGASVKHSFIFKNVFTELVLQIERKSNCLVFPSDQQLYVPECESFYYPDMMVVCEKPQYYKNEKTGRVALLNPSVIVEILSPSTEIFDRTIKWNCYKTIESLKEYIIVNQSEKRVEKYSRMDAKKWIVEDAVGENAEIQISIAAIVLADIYKNTEDLPKE